MQERRTTIRFGRLSRVQYCPADDLIPRDGRLTDLSERGAGLLAQETHRAGARVTISFPLPEEETMVTATGVVRWSDAQIRQGRWYPLGLEWLPLEETARYRLHEFLSRRTTALSPRRPAGLQRAEAKRLFFRLVAVLGALIVMGLVLWATALQGENRKMGGALQQRNAIIRHFEGRESQLQEELTAARTNLGRAADAMAALDQQSRGLEADVQRLNEDVERFQESYVQVREERETLMQRVLDLEQERTLLAKRLSSIPALRLAIQEAIGARRAAQRQAHLQTLLARQETAQQAAAEGNRGYLVRHGRPTTAPGTVWIRVHEPEPLINQ